MIDTETTRPDAANRKKRWMIPLVTLAVVLLTAAGGLYWFFSGEAPEEVDLAATVSSVAVADSNPGETETNSAGIEGTWSVDTSIGEFTLEEATTATFVGFRVAEVLSSIGSTTAVGRTPTVDGSITIDGTTLTTAEISADLTAIVSDESRREDSIQRAVGTASNPQATFVLTEPVDLGAGAADGDPVSVKAVGELTINGVTNTVEIELDAQLVDGVILVTGATDVVFADYDVTVPSSPAVLSVEDVGVVEIQLWLSR